MGQGIQEPTSPCVHHCGFRNGCCRNCYRTSEEVQHWRTMTPAEKSQVMALAERRRTEAQGLS